MPDSSKRLDGGGHYDNHEREILRTTPRCQETRVMRTSKEPLSPREREFLYNTTSMAHNGGRRKTRSELADENLVPLCFHGAYCQTWVGRRSSPHPFSLFIPGSGPTPSGRTCLSWLCQSAPVHPGTCLDGTVLSSTAAATGIAAKVSHLPLAPRRRHYPG